MEVSTIYATRDITRSALPQAIADIIAKLKISFKPAFRRPFVHQKRHHEHVNWRENVLIDLVRKVREKDDVDYDEVSAAINKISKQNYEKMMSIIMEKLAKRDMMFRLRVTTLLFDRGVLMTFFAPMMADVYRDISKVYPDALQDLAIQTTMFETLYDVSNVTMVPTSDNVGYDDAIITWSKQKEKKRGFAVYVSELYVRELVPRETMASFITTVLDELKENLGSPKTAPKEEHVDALVRFLFAVVGKLPEIKPAIAEILKIPRTETLCLNMKSRFKLEDALK